MPALPSSLPVLHTARLVLRAVTMDDIDDLRAVYGDPDVMRYGSDPAFSQDADDLQTVPVSSVSWWKESPSNGVWC
ncbi:GNAT family N-acetyltransferase [Duganella sp. Leaf126]|uniref:GNAT family N-acetyltransferase n=1 Tax=Duganella sp. Leaf126 TaxID=1736266 RepID=UPI000A4BA194|nr:GNAT family N-acetyltransferase [Duganella sp. Leaf126]